MSEPFVITIVGAESSGKTTLALQLADRYLAAFVPEFSREYLHSINRPYSYEDLKTIFHGQLNLIQEALKGHYNRAAPINQVADFDKRLDSLIEIIDQQIKNSIPPIIFVDGGMLTLKLWARIKFNRDIDEVDNALKEDVSNLYILVRPRLQWEPDPLREAPEIVDRVWIYNQYQIELAKGRIPFIIFPFE